METLNNCTINEIYELAPKKHTLFYLKKRFDEVMPGFTV